MMAGGFWKTWAARAVCAVGMALGVAAAAAAQTTEEQVQRLEREVAELKAALAAIAAQTAAPAAPALEELARRIDLLAAEVEQMKLGAVAPKAAAEELAVEGFGPAASKVYNVEQGLSIGGYGEMVYQGFDSRRDDGVASGRKDELDFLRAIVYVGYKWNDEWLFNSEIEFEHAKAGEGQRGEVAVEFAYLDRQIRPEINARAGLVLMPMGLVNELHEPTVFLGSRRPGIESAILPTTWRENGAGVYGDVGPLTYRTFVVNGLEAERFTAGGIRSARQNGARTVAEDLAWVGRIDWTGLPGLVAGVSGYVGDSAQDITDAGGELSVDTRIVEGHVDWRGHGLQLRGLWVDAELDGVARLNEKLGLTGNRSVGDSMSGYYVEAGYDVMGLADSSRQSLVPFARWESYDTQDSVPAGFARNPANDVDVLTLGINWKPIEQLIFKADWQDVDNGAGTGVDQINFALGYVF
jgi:hypothetical protein